MQESVLETFFSLHPDPENLEQTLAQDVYSQKPFLLLEEACPLSAVLSAANEVLEAADTVAEGRTPCNSKSQFGCPVPGCKANVKRLWNHLFQFHKKRDTYIINPLLTAHEPTHQHLQSDQQPQESKDSSEKPMQFNQHGARVDLQKEVCFDAHLVSVSVDVSHTVLPLLLSHYIMYQHQEPTHSSEQHMQYQQQPQEPTHSSGYHFQSHQHHPFYRHTLRPPQQSLGPTGYHLQSNHQQQSQPTHSSGTCSQTTSNHHLEPPTPLGATYSLTNNYKHTPQGTTKHLGPPNILLDPQGTTCSPTSNHAICNTVWTL